MWEKTREKVSAKTNAAPTSSTLPAFYTGQVLLHKHLIIVKLLVKYYKNWFEDWNPQVAENNLFIME